MTINIAIVDDSKADALTLKELITDWSEKTSNVVNIITYQFPEAVLLELDSKALNFSIFFIDVMMPNVSGMDLVQSLHSNNSKKALFILISQEQSYMKKGYEVEAFDFLCKPFDVQDVNCILDRAYKKLSESMRHEFIFSSDKIVRKMNCSEILYITVSRNYAKLISFDNHAYIFRSTLKELLSSLPDYFIPVSRNSIVNVTNISSISSKDVKFPNGQSIEVTKVSLPHIISTFKLYS